MPDSDVFMQFAPVKPPDGSTPRVLPANPGFVKRRVLDARFDPRSFQASMCCRLQIEHSDVTIIAGLGQLPIGGGGYLHTLLIKWSNPLVKNEAFKGIIYEGSPFNPHRKAGNMRLDTIPDADVATVQACDNIGQALLKALALYASLDGCVLNSKKAIEFFGEGHIDIFLSDVLSYGHIAALKRCDPFSVERVPDLYYETGLGIVYDDTSELPAIGKSDPGVTTPRFIGRPIDQFDQMRRAFGDDPWFKDLGPTFRGTHGMFTGRVHFEGLSGGNTNFHYAWNSAATVPGNRDYGDPGEPIVYYRPAIRGTDVFARADLIAMKIRFIGVIIVTTKRLSFEDMREYHRQGLG